MAARRKAFGMSFGITASSYVDGPPPLGDSAYANAVLSESPLVYLPLNETSGTTAVDISGNGHDGYYYDSAVAGNYGVVSGSNGSGRSARVDYGTYGGIVIPHGAYMDTTDMTVLIPWMVYNASGIQMLAARYPDDNSLNLDSWFIDIGAGSTLWFWWRTSTGGNVGIDSGFTPQSTDRLFVAAYVNSSESGILIYGDDGALVGFGTGSGGAINTTSGNLTLFSSEAGYQSWGYIDDFALFGRSLSTTTIDSLAALALAPNQTWIAKTEGSTGRNGTYNHTINFSPASSGSLLVAIIGGPVTNTMVTSGWTKQISSLHDTELAVFTKTASSGESSLEVAHNGANYPVEYTIYEFAAGSAYHSGASAINGIPTLSGLPGSNITLFAAQCNNYGGVTPSYSTNWRVFWRTEVNRSTPYSGTDGSWLNIGYFALNDFPDATANISPPQYDAAPGDTAIVFAIQHT